MVMDAQGHDETFGEMTAAQKGSVSPRRRAWDALAAELQ